jgi:hypothetical protein
VGVVGIVSSEVGILDRDSMLDCRSTVLVVSAPFRKMSLYMLQKCLLLIRYSFIMRIGTTIEPHVSNGVNGDLRQDSGVSCQDEGIYLPATLYITCYITCLSLDLHAYSLAAARGVGVTIVGAYALDDFTTVGHLERFPEPSNQISMLGSAFRDDILCLRACIVNSTRCSSTRTCGRPCGGQ